jgi:hypothetical protein
VTCAGPLVVAVPLPAAEVEEVSSPPALLVGLGGNSEEEAVGVGVLLPGAGVAGAGVLVLGGIGATDVSVLALACV